MQLYTRNRSPEQEPDVGADRKQTGSATVQNSPLALLCSVQCASEKKLVKKKVFNCKSLRYNLAKKITNNVKSFRGRENLILLVAFL